MSFAAKVLGSGNAEARTTARSAPLAPIRLPAQRHEIDSVSHQPPRAHQHEANRSAELVMADRFDVPRFGHDFARLSIDAKRQDGADRVRSAWTLQRMLGVRAKSWVSEPNDAHEREADAVAEQVMRSPTCHCGGKSGCATCGSGKSSPASVFRSSTAVPGPWRTAAPPIVHEVLRGSGVGLDGSTRAFFESRLGRDLGDVRVHTGEHAGASAQAIGARAYTVGSNVVFAPGEFSPSTDGGRRLIAHELAHVMQQTSGGYGELARVPTESGARDGRYTFSSNCGWIDWDHASPGLARALIQRVQAASDALASAGSGATATTGRLTTPTMRSGGFGVVLSSATLRVRLLRALSATEVLAVALGIFKTLSIVFETQQAWTDVIGESSFAQEDLPSNLIGFYVAAHNFSRADIMQFCGGVDAANSVAEFQRNHAFVRNRTFEPIGATGPWPAQLSTINDSAVSNLYEVQEISATQGTDQFRFCPMYRVVGLIGATDLLLLSIGGRVFTASDDLRVVPTYSARPTMSGAYGHAAEIEVKPARPSDADLLRRSNISWPLRLPEGVLQCLTSHANSSSPSRAK